MQDVTSLVESIFARVHTLTSTDTRTIIAIGGPPASGKSTLAEQLQLRLNEASLPCGLVPMDGFHLDNETLIARGHLSRKGAPETFDTEGFMALIQKLTHEREIPVPLFDRERDCVIKDAVCITAKHHYVVVEGNYLFLNEGLWRDLQSYWSLSVFIAPPLQVLEQRLMQRWLEHGLDEAAAKARTLTNDIPNAKLILSQSRMQTIDILLT